MAYTRHTWQSGEVISSALLNNIEDGIEEAASSGGGGGVLGVTVTEDDTGETFSRTWQEIYDTMDNGGIVFSHMKDANETISIGSMIESCGYDDNNGYYIISGGEIAMCENPNEYPKISHNISPDS